jgi:bile acid-coenzyme A ligase
MDDAAIERTWSTRIDELADEHPDTTALIVTGAAGGSLSWRELANRSAGVARLFAGHGIVHGSVVSILLPNCLAHVLATLAAWRLGATVLSMRHDLPLPERARMFELAHARLVVNETGIAAETGASGHALSAADVMAVASRPAARLASLS